MKEGRKEGRKDERKEKRKTGITQITFTIVNVPTEDVSTHVKYLVENKFYVE